MINYYVDPGSGFAYVQNTSFFWGIVLSILGAFVIFLRPFLKFIRKAFKFLLFFLMIIIIGGIIMHKPFIKDKVIILGIDAMDPQIAQKLMKEGRMPNLAGLKAKGAYSPLETVVPSQTAVVWSSFSTGLKPAEHGIFDFVMRNPQDYSLYLSLNEVCNTAGKININIRKHGENFWSILSRKNVPSFIYFCPNTFPPDHINGAMVSGMGVPDITGTIGRFSFYTTKRPDTSDSDSRGKIIHVDIKDNSVFDKLYGPKVMHIGRYSECSVNLKITLRPDEGGAYIEFPKAKFFLKKGCFSPWQKVSFKLSNFKSIHGIVRFYLKSLEPDFELYTSPINFDPERPPFAISYPKSYSGELADKTGLYYTQGMPYDTWALSEGRIDERAFLEQVDEVIGEQERILKYGLKKFNGGVFFFYFETLDVIQHMFWRYIDTKSAIYENNPEYSDLIYRYYERIDRIIGEVVKSLHDDEILIVLSDHGFGDFRKSVHLNRWLLENGYLFLKNDKSEGKEFFQDVDWSKTMAYALGFGGIYLNKSAREHFGIVKGIKEQQHLKQEIADKLAHFKDPESQDDVVSRVYMQEEVFVGSYSSNAPDLFVGFNRGYRASWQTSLGGVPEVIIEDNIKKWSGDHLVDSALVPGVIFLNKKTELAKPNIIDIAPTILNFFGVSRCKEMEGKILFKKEDNR